MRTEIKTLLIFLFLTALTEANDCPERWEDTLEGDQGRCYRFEEEPQIWERAQEMCRSAHGELLSIRSEPEKEWIQMRMSDFSRRETKPLWQWWSGLYLEDDGNWIWSDGTPADEALVSWQPNQPDQASEAEKCGEFHPTGMNDNTCSSTFPYICTKAKGQPSSPCHFGEIETGGSCVNPHSQKPVGEESHLPAGQEPIQGSCAEGWWASPQISDRCYRFETVPQSWDNAKSICELAHGHLTSLRSEEEKDWIRGQVERLGHERSAWFGLYQEPARPKWWTGLNRIDGGWKWADEETVIESLIDWKAGEPNNHHNEDCGELHVTGFNDNRCSIKFPYICARPKSNLPEDECPFGEHMVEEVCVKYVPVVITSTPPPTPTPLPTPTSTPTPSHVPVQGDCPVGWESSTSSPDKCYRFENERKLTWDHARRLCQSARGELVSFRNRNQLAWIRKALNGMSQPPYTWWTGLNRLGRDATWHWSDNSQLIEDNIPWQPNEPNNEMEQCGELHRSGMNDNGCWKKLNFICSREKDIIRNPVECHFGSILMGRQCENVVFQTPSPPLPGACSDGWVEAPVNPGTCYRFVTQTLSASDAKLMCQAAHGDLVVIKAVAEKEWLEQQVNRETETNGNWEFYIGLEQVSNKWKWADGTEVSDIESWLEGSNSHGTCCTMLPAGTQRDQCYSSKAYICSRPAELNEDMHICPWGLTWQDGSCQQLQLNTHYASKADYFYGHHSVSLEDKVRRLKEKHEREVGALKQDFNWQLGNLTQRVQILERVLNIRRAPSDKDQPVLDFDPSLTLIISRLPENLTAAREDTETVVRRFFNEILELDSDVKIVHASRSGGKGNNPVKIKVLMEDQASKRAVMAARKRVKGNPEYRNIRIVASPMRLRSPKT